MGFGGHPLAAIFFEEGRELFTVLFETLLFRFHLFLRVDGCILGTVDYLSRLFLHGLLRGGIHRKQRVFVINHKTGNNDQADNQVN
jgi:hypothetical protein